jgi:hypothetical protein
MFASAVLRNQGTEAIALPNLDCITKGDSKIQLINARFARIIYKYIVTCSSGNVTVFSGMLV